NRGDVRHAPWFREPIMGFTSQSKRPDLFGHEWWDRSTTTNRRSLKQPIERENLGFKRERHLDHDHVSLWYHRHRKMTPPRPALPLDLIRQTSRSPSPVRAGGSEKRSSL